MDTGHFQIGWILDDPFSMRYTEKRIYNQTTKYVSEIFGSDEHFTGWNIKNPNCLYNTRTYWFNDTINKQELIQSLKNTHNGMSDTPSVKEKQITEPVVIDYKPTTYVDDQSSRNCSLFKELHKWMRDYVREKGELPSHNETWKRGYEISVVLGRMTHKERLMSKSSELWYENNLNGFKTIVKDKIKGVVSYKFFTGQIERDNWMFQDYEMYEDIVDGLYLECLPKIEETIWDVVECNFECLKKVS